MNQKVNINVNILKDLLSYSDHKSRDDLEVSVNWIRILLILLIKYYSFCSLLYYRKSDNIIYMGLLGFLFKTNSHRRLAELLWTDGLTASVHELSKMSGLPYATAHELLQRMEKMGLVQKVTQGRATLFSSKLNPEELRSLKGLLGNGEGAKKKPLSDFPEMDLPLVGEFPDFQSEKAQNVNELLVKAVVLAKKNSSLLRTLPLLVKRLGERLNVDQLTYWSKLYHADRELGFVLDLTSELSQDKSFSRLARKLKDKRWSKQTSFLEKESKLQGFQAQLLAENTPELAKKWFLKVNMGLDSFRSHYLKFA